MKKKIKTAVLPAGGYGMRFLPTTKSIPKEMLPLDGKPVILRVVEEAVEAGIENIIFVVSYNKDAIEKLFAPNETLEDYYKKNSNLQAAKQIKNISKLANFTFVYTEWPNGNGGALITARHLLGNDPFLLMWTDEIILSKKTSRAKQCLETYNKFGLPVVSMIKVDEAKQRKNYGMADISNFRGNKNVKTIKRIIEKPALGKEPSVYAAHGAYVLDNSIFKAIDKLKPVPGKELWLTDIINELASEAPVLGKIIDNAAYLDCGTPMNYLYSQIDYALEFSPNKKEIQEFLKSKLGCPLPNNIKFKGAFNKK